MANDLASVVTYEIGGIVLLLTIIVLLTIIGISLDRKLDKIIKLLEREK